MKTSTLLYAVSLILIVASIFMLVQMPTSGRNHVISGGLLLFGLPMNIVAFSVKKRQLN